ncbi:hypothetical protein M8C21_005603 [Ambrosia artemisiifolia]|uniref:Uncharacterized protein n=1 Tax=Ambrosia artemisiifolia TaxID=4212 RepID=A0AAD5D7R3_AMBAR|nr:hypothetical protein M8C21_005603 [Ambrosia artemisiifolia]
MTGSRICLIRRSPCTHIAYLALRHG